MTNGPEQYRHIERTIERTSMIVVNDCPNSSQSSEALPALYTGIVRILNLKSVDETLRRKMSP